MEKAGCMIAIIFFLAIVILSYVLDSKECKAKAKVIGYKCEYSFWAGCVLEKPNGKRVLLEQLRGIEEIK